MEIRKTNNIKFEGNVLHSLVTSTKNKKLPISFVEIDFSNPSDIEAVGKAKRYWRNNFFLKQIYNMALDKYKNRDFYPSTHVCILTSQEKGFEKLIYDKILGIVHFVQTRYPKEIRIEHIETKPKYRVKNREINGVGSYISDFLKCDWDFISAVARDDAKVRNFYLRNEYKEAYLGTNLFSWEKIRL